jgi:hypothetical protein
MEISCSPAAAVTDSIMVISLSCVCQTEMGISASSGRLFLLVLVL